MREIENNRAECVFPTIYRFNGMYKFLDPAYEFTIIWNGVEYPSLLHCFCGCRFKDKELSKRCAGSKDLIELYSIIERVRKGVLLIDNFEIREEDILLDICRLRFSGEQAKYLLSTRNCDLVFTSKSYVLGRARNSDKKRRNSGKSNKRPEGLNLLGKCLVYVREEIKHGQNDYAR